MALHIKKDLSNMRRDKPDLSSVVFGKVPPQAPEFEEAVLGAILLESEALPTARAVLTEYSFYVDAHQKIFAAVTRLFNRGASIDLITTTEELRKADELEIVGGAYFLTRLTMNVVSGAHVDEHSRIVQEKYLMREIIRVSGTAIGKAYDNSTDVFELLESLEKEILQLSIGNVQKQYVRAPELAARAKERQKEKNSNPNKVSGVPSGYRAIDRLINGWQKNTLIIIAARPSIGKTAFALNLALNASDAGFGVLFFSLEMSETELMERIMSSESHVYLSNIQRGNMAEWEQKAYNDANEKFSKRNFQIDDTAALSMYALRTKARRAVVKDGVQMIVVDYLQLMQGDENQKGNREQEISKISRDLKTLAKEVEIPIIALSQLNRGVESRGKTNGSAKPQLSDLRESGAIEQDADIVMFLGRPDYQQAEDKTDPALKDDADVYIAKHRAGAIDDFKMKMVKNIQTWFDLTGYDSYKNNITFGDPRENIYNPRAGMSSGPVSRDITQSNQEWEAGAYTPPENIEDLPF